MNIMPKRITSFLGNLKHPKSLLFSVLVIELVSDSCQAMCHKVFSPNSFPLLFSMFFLVAMFSSCSSKKYQISMLGSNEKSIPLFIAMPYCNCVFKNIAPTIYQSVAHHFRHVGYTLVSRQENGYTLQITIKNLSPIINFVSPDVLLFHLTMRLELVCE